MKPKISLDFQICISVALTLDEAAIEKKALIQALFNFEAVPYMPQSIKEHKKELLSEKNRS